MVRCLCVTSFAALCLLAFASSSSAQEKPAQPAAGSEMAGSEKAGITMPIPPKSPTGWYSQEELDHAMQAAKMFGMPMAVMYQDSNSSCPKHNSQRDSWMRAPELSSFVRVILNAKGANMPPLFMKLLMAAKGKQGRFIPQLYLAASDETYYGVVPYNTPPQPFIATVSAALQKHGPVLPVKTTLDLWRKLANGRKLWEAGNHEGALKQFQAIVRVRKAAPQSPILAEYGKDELEVKAYLDKKVAAAKALAEAGDVKAGRDELAEIASKYFGFDAASEAKKLLKELPRRATAGSKPTTSSGSALRTWTNQSGQHKIEAELVAAKQGWIQLKKPSGELTAIHVEKLCEDDQAYVKNWLNERR